MSRRNVAYVKPPEPEFLRQLKEQAGYREGPSVDTKREQLQDSDEDCREPLDDEKPTVVVLKPGDLTADQADQEQKRIEQAEAEAPADLSARIVFRPKSKNSEDKGGRKRSGDKEEGTKGGKKSKGKSKTLLSFEQEDYDD